MLLRAERGWAGVRACWRERERPHHGAAGMRMDSNRHSRLDHADQFRDGQRERYPPLSGSGECGGGSLFRNHHCRRQFHGRAGSGRVTRLGVHRFDGASRGRGELDHSVHDREQRHDFGNCAAELFRRRQRPYWQRRADAASGVSTATSCGVAATGCFAGSHRAPQCLIDCRHPVSAGATSASGFRSTDGHRFAGWVRDFPPDCDQSGSGGAARNPQRTFLPAGFRQYRRPDARCGGGKTSRRRPRPYR